MNVFAKTRRNALGTSIVVLSLLGACADDARCLNASGSSVAGDAKILQNVDSAGVAIQGYDPVGYFTEHRALKGDPQWQSTYCGAVYQFASAADKATFDANPAKYEPQFGGYCAYAASINKVSPIDPKYWEVVDGRLLLQHNQKAWDLWHKDVSGNLAKADSNWPEIIRRQCN